MLSSTCHSGVITCRLPTHLKSVRNTRNTLLVAVSAKAVITKAATGKVSTWRPLDDKFKVGVGLTAFFFMRSDIGNYAPIPGILPAVSTGYGPLDIQMAYIPGGQGNGNVLFWWAKYSFK